MSSSFSNVNCFVFVWGFLGGFFFFFNFFFYQTAISNKICDLLICF